MATIKEILGQGDIPKPTRNFLKENVRRLKDMKLEKTTKTTSQCSRATANSQLFTERSKTVNSRNSSRLRAESRVKGPSPSCRGCATNARLASETVQQAEADPHRSVLENASKSFRNQECQTLNSKQLESLYNDSVIWYPSVRATPADPDTRSGLNRQAPSVKETGLQTDDEPQGQEKEFAIPECHKPRSSESSDPTRAPPSYQRGVVPKYLREHKKEVERERVARAQEAAQDCPEGHVLLPEDVRTKHLSTLREKYESLVSQLNKLPVSTDTLRTRMRKKEIERDLDSIEAAMALFSREKVFIKADS